MKAGRRPHPLGVWTAALLVAAPIPQDTRQDNPRDRTTQIMLSDTTAYLETINHPADLVDPADAPFVAEWCANYGDA